MQGRERATVPIAKRSFAPNSIPPSRPGDLCLPSQVEVKTQQEDVAIQASVPEPLGLGHAHSIAFDSLGMGDSAVHGS